MPAARQLERLVELLQLRSDAHEFRQTRDADICSRVLSGPIPITSYTLIGSLTPLIRAAPSGFKSK